MSTISTQSQVPKGFHIPKKMKRLILFAIFFGLFAFSMSIFIKAKHHSRYSYSHSDSNIHELIEEVRQLKASQNSNRKWIQALHENQRNLIENQEGLTGGDNSRLLNEISRVERMIVETQKAYHNMHVQLQQQDNYIKTVVRNLEANRGPCQGGQQNCIIGELQNSQRELSNRLESFRSALQGLEVKMNTNNRQIVEEMNGLRNSASRTPGNLDNYRQLLNEVSAQKNLINQVSQSQAKQNNEVKDINRVLNNLKDYTVESLQQLGKQNNLNEKRINNVENNKGRNVVSGRQSEDNSQLSIDFKNFKEYVTEALNELRSQNTKNTKRINHIESKEIDTAIVPTSDVVSQEVEKFFSGLGEGRLLEKILEETNLSMTDVQTFVRVLKMITEGDVNGLLTTFNELAGGDLVKKLMGSKNGLLKDFKPVIKMVKDLSEGKLSNVMKYASWVNKFMGGDSQDENISEDNVANNNTKQRKVQKDLGFGLEDLLEWF